MTAGDARAPFAVDDPKHESPPRVQPMSPPVSCGVALHTALRDLEAHRIRDGNQFNGLRLRSYAPVPSRVRRELSARGSIGIRSDSSRGRQLAADPGARSPADHPCSVPQSTSASQCSADVVVVSAIQLFAPLQGRVQIGPEIVHVLNPDAQPEQRRWQVRLTRNARPPLNRRLDRTQTRGVLNEPDP